jgi:hypothetical protein
LFDKKIAHSEARAETRGLCVSLVAINRGPAGQ